MNIGTSQLAWARLGSSLHPLAEALLSNFYACDGFAWDLGGGVDRGSTVLACCCRDELGFVESSRGKGFASSCKVFPVAVDEPHRGFPR